MCDMRPSLFCCLLALVITGSLSGLAGQPTGQATPENAFDQDSAAVADRPTANDPEKSVEQPERPAETRQGTLVRPKDGVQHPDLDKLWAEYDAAAKIHAEAIKAAIDKQFQAATAKGDLDNAEKWQAASEAFLRKGVVPAAPETKSAVKAAETSLQKARESLGNAYDQVIRLLTKDQNLVAAKQVREEWRKLTSTSVAAVTAGTGGDQRRSSRPDGWPKEGRYALTTNDRRQIFFQIDGDVVTIHGYSAPGNEVYWQPSPKPLKFTFAEGKCTTPYAPLGECLHSLQWHTQTNQAMRRWKQAGKEGAEIGKVRLNDWVRPDN